MDENKVMKKLSNIFKDVFDDDKLIINSNSSSSNVMGWDSLNHIYLVVAIEKEFDINFTTELIMSWENVGAMATYIAENVSD